MEQPYKTHSRKVSCLLKVLGISLFVLAVFFLAATPAPVHAYFGSLYGGWSQPYNYNYNNYGSYWPYSYFNSYGNWGISPWLPQSYSPYSYNYNPYNYNYNYYPSYPLQQYSSLQQYPFGSYLNSMVAPFAVSGASWLIQPYAALGLPSYLMPSLSSSGVGYPSFDLCQTSTNQPAPGLYGKPAIYLYPREDTSASVKLDIDGELTKTIPPYNNGWRVLAKTDGTITDKSQGKQYDYLFWEAKPKTKVELPDKGWIVASRDLEDWFNEYLPKLGLNKKEKEQFMEYWLERLQGKDYYELKLLSSEFLEEHAKLTITPSPDTLIRVIFHFTPLDESEADKYKTLEPPLIKTPERKGFVALEWGGILGEEIAGGEIPI